MAMDDRRRLSEEELFFYEDKVCGEADIVYRFCIALTLNHDLALKLLYHSYKDVAANIGKYIGKSSAALRVVLFKFVFNNFDKMKKEAASKSAGSPLMQFLKGLSLDVRAMLVASDVSGMSIKELVEIFAEDEKTIESKLINARKALLTDAKFA